MKIGDKVKVAKPRNVSAFTTKEQAWYEKTFKNREGHIADIFTEDGRPYCARVEFGTEDSYFTVAELEVIND
jgi:flavodoxin